MKRSMIITAVMAASFAAHGEYILELRHVDGRLEQIRTSDIESVTFTTLEEGVDFIDLGLPSGTLWATRNVGAQSPLDPGEVYLWGSTAPFKISDNLPLTNQFSNLTLAELQDAGTVDELNRLKPELDAASVNMGTAYRMPSAEEWQELFDNCSRQVIPAPEPNDDGLYNYIMRFTGPNGSTLDVMMPTMIYKKDNANTFNIIRPVSLGGASYWASTAYANHEGDLNIDCSSNAAALGAPVGSYNGDTVLVFNATRDRACSVRPVLNIKKTETR